MRGGGGKEAECVKENKQGEIPLGINGMKWKRGQIQCGPSDAVKLNGVPSPPVSPGFDSSTSTESPPEDRFMLICKSIRPYSESPAERAGRTEKHKTVHRLSHRNSRTSTMNNNLHPQRSLLCH